MPSNDAFAGHNGLYELDECPLWYENVWRFCKHFLF